MDREESKTRFTVSGVIASLAKKGVKITTDSSLNYFSRRAKGERQLSPFTVDVCDAHNMGLGSWAKVDFLVNRNRFILSGLEIFSINAVELH